MAKTMKIILLKPVEKLGREGEIRDVALGYARNYLLPRGLADLATPELVAQVTRRRARELRAAEMDLKNAEQLAARLGGQEVALTAKASSEGTLYAAVSPAMIAASLQARGFAVTKDQITADHLKQVGEHEVVVSLPHGLECTITVTVAAAQT